ncbi:MAG: holo-ACP synthase [Thermoleophilia bacterium]|nr:holo-ACP synthase [Thermoleophilia bacterium]
MATVGLGIDLVEISRVERALERHPRLADRLFTEAELEYSTARGRPGRHLAARFAAKEAAVKAMSLSPGVRLKDIEVVSGSPPEFRFHREVAATASERRLSVRVSLTHDRETAGAVAIAEVA